MKAQDIKVGGVYVAKVSNKLTKVRVDKIRIGDGWHAGKSSDRKVYDCTNLSTNQQITFRSAAKFRSEVKNLNGAKVVEGTFYTPATEATNHPDYLEGEQRSDPMLVGVAHSADAGDNHSNTSPALDDVARQTAPTDVVPVTATVRSGFAAKFDGTKLQSSDNGNRAPHVIVRARAGTGKTTTIVTGLKVLKGIDPGITPSEQQQQVWDAISLSKDAKSIGFVAFNKSIATELSRRVPQGCEAMTMHSMGFRAVQKSFGRVAPEQNTVPNIICEILGEDIRDVRKSKAVILSATERLVSLCKMNLSNIDPCGNWIGAVDPDWSEILDQLASHYDVDLNGSREDVYRLVPQVLERCKHPQGQINFDDMIWLPVVLDLPMTKYDLLLVDEAQDLNRCQQALAKKAGRRLILVGDDRQAIYGFAGADADSLPRLERELSATDVTCEVIPLTVTRRCGRNVVNEARKYVPDFEAHETNSEGVIDNANFAPDHAKAYQKMASDGDMVLCRVNAPLVSECFRFLKEGRKASIQGRDIAAGLTSLIKRLIKDEWQRNASGSAKTLVGLLSDWLHEETSKEQKKRNPSENKLTALEDRHDCIVCFCEGMNSANDVIRRIESIFTDNKDAPGIRLSSIHRAKGLEAHRVFWLRTQQAEKVSAMAKSSWEQQQEENLKYVAITRAVETLVYVFDDKA